MEVQYAHDPWCGNDCFCVRSLGEKKKTKGADTPLSLLAFPIHLVGHILPNGKPSHRCKLFGSPNRPLRFLVTLARSRSSLPPTAVSCEHRASWNDRHVSSDKVGLTGKNVIRLNSRRARQAFLSLACCGEIQMIRWRHRSEPFFRSEASDVESEPNLSEDRQLSDSLRNPIQRQPEANLSQSA